MPEFGIMEERLLSFRRIDPITECWRTTGFINPRSGYGTLKLRKNKTITLHRLSAHIYLGLELDDKKQQSNHKQECKYKDCFNPDHLYVGSQSQNIQDAVFAKTQVNSRKTHCPKGHLYDEINTMLRLRNGSQQRVCRECDRDRSRERYRQIAKEKRLFKQAVSK